MVIANTTQNTSLLGLVLANGLGTSGLHCALLSALGIIQAQRTFVCGIFILYFVYVFK